jgi:hypothetical protein
MKKTALFTTLLCLTPGNLFADVPLFINYQGKVFDSAGLPLGATGSATAPVAAPVNRKVLFRFYDAVTGGTRLWTEEQTVTIAVGEFSVLLGQGIDATGTAAGESRPTIDSVFTSGTPSRFLEITVDNGDGSISALDVPITPRQQITTTAFSFRARTADSIAGSSDLAITPLAGTASNYGLGWYGTGRLFGGVAIDGPVLYGNAGGALGSNTNGTYNTALRWNAAGQLGVGTATLAGAAASSKLVLQGNEGSTPAQQLVIRGETDPNKRLLLGFDTTLNQASLQSYGTTTTAANLLLNPAGGNVGIGTSATARLDVAGTISGTSSISAAGASGFVFRDTETNGGLFSPADGVITLQTNAVERLRVDANGNVGIGQSAPAFPLSFASTTGDKISLYGASGANYGFGVQSNLLQIRTPTSTGDVAFGHGTSAAMTETMRIGGDGNVGIGTSSPASRLSISDGASDAGRYGSLQISRAANSHTASHIAFIRGPGTNVIGLGYKQSSTLFGFGSGTTGVFNPNLLSIDTDGTTSIGTTTALGKLNVGSQTATWEAFGKLTTDGGFNTNETETNRPLSIVADGYMLATQYSISSDVRIKTAIHPTNGAEDLKSLLGIHIMDYRLIDTVVNGNAPEKKVIAQQVESVYPIAVSKDRGVVPDIYRNAPFRDGWVEMVSSLKVGERVKLIGPSGESVTEVLEVKDGGFRTAFQPGGDKVFVYGREVLDFHTVDYDAIAMLNVSATQQIKREKDAEIKALQDENSALRAKLALQSDTTDSLEARLIAIERRLTAGNSTAETVSLKTGTVSLKTANAAQ